MSCLGDEVPTLAVVGPLVLEPLSVSLYTANLLTVVVGDGIGDRVGGRVNAVLANAVEEFFLFLEIEKTVCIRLDRDELSRSICRLTIATDGLNRRYTNPQTPFPTIGPASHPTAPQAAVAIPRTTKGSSPMTWAPRDSRSCPDRI